MKLIAWSSMIEVRSEFMDSRSPPIQEVVRCFAGHQLEQCESVVLHTSQNKETSTQFILSSHTFTIASIPEDPALIRFRQYLVKKRIRIFNGFFRRFREFDTFEVGKFGVA